LEKSEIMRSMTHYMPSEQPLRVLGIETSCDETSISLLSVSAEDVQVEYNLVSSQIDIHQRYGGVVPEVAARSHVPEMIHLLTEAFGEDWSQAFDALAVTRGPGLSMALLVGLEAAKILAVLSGKPIVGVNHLEGHLASAWLNAENRKRWTFPLLALSASGGHSELILVKDVGVYELIGGTRDDAAGEAFDKTAKMMGLPYPGGPQIEKLSLLGNPGQFKLPRPMLDEDSLDMSFSGLKTAVRQMWEKEAEMFARNAQARADLALEVQTAIIDVLIEKTRRAIKRTGVRAVALVGGVSASASLRARMKTMLEERFPGVAFLPSDRAYVTDNAAMIAAAGSWHLLKGESHDPLMLDEVLRRLRDDARHDPEVLSLVSGYLAGLAARRQRSE
jgi:N6-L-threonylcarbamoyladenine synthase